MRTRLRSYHLYTTMAVLQRLQRDQEHCICDNHRAFPPCYYNRSTSLVLVGLNFGVLIAWIVISSMKMPLIQWYVRRKVVAENRRALEVSSREENGIKREAWVASPVIPDGANLMIP